MKTRLIVCAAIAAILVLALSGAGQQSAEQLYKSGLYEEEVGGDLQKAIGTYQDLLKRFPDNREIAAMAQLHIGLCHEKLGTKEAEKAFQKVIDNYPEQGEAVREAKEKLSLLFRSSALIKTGDAEFNLRQVWAGSGVDILGAVSPDGRYLSFVDWETGDLAIRELATGTNHRLTNKGSWTQSPEFALFSEWSPDSQRIVYQWYNKDEIFELRIVDIEASNPRILYQPRTKEDYVQPFDWSPDGKSILAGFFRGTTLIERLERLGLVSVAEGSVKVLKTQFETHSANPKPWGFVFSPDGKYIAYNISQEGKADEKPDIFLLSVDGGTEIPLIEHPANDSVIDWTPDGEGLLFISDRTGTQDVWFIRIAGGKPLGSPLLVKPGVGPIEPMGITSRGALFYGLQGGATDVYEVGIDPRTGKILSPAKKAVVLYEGHNAYPDYSPDGKLLAYIYRSSMPTFEPRQVLGILSLETGRVHELNPDLVRFGYPRWAPDGRSISVEGTGKDGRLGIYRVDIQTSDVVPIVLIDKGTEIYSHRWSKDGKVMFYSTGDRAGKSVSVFVHNFETGREERLSGSPSNAHWIDISPDGKWLVLVNQERNRVMRIMPTSGGDPREIYSFEQEGNYIITPAWSADGRYIYFSKLQKSPGVMWDLYRVSADGGEAQKIDLAMGQFRHLSVHPDGQHIAFSSMGANPEQSQVWVMENFLPGDKVKK
ncbi:MAG: tetratricopeptide repeat protein [Candidatus Aminicenantes bacterium]|nr:tetratricopeptide repeat protein [Candidatus Aminicenantes bacterium]